MELHTKEAENLNDSLLNNEVTHLIKVLQNKGKISCTDYLKGIECEIKEMIENESRLTSAELLTSTNIEIRKMYFKYIMFMFKLYSAIFKNLDTDAVIKSTEVSIDFYYIRKNILEEIETEFARIPEEFFTCPASTKYHGAFCGGLFRHSITVLMAVLQTYKVYLEPVSNYNIRNACDSVASNYMAILLHDLCKVGKYVYNPTKDVYDYNKNAEPSFQHGAESYRRMVDAMFFVSKNWELAVAYHMGCFDTSKQETMDFSSITEKVPEVLLLHHADMIAAKIYHI